MILTPSRARWRTRPATTCPIACGARWPTRATLRESPVSLLVANLLSAAHRRLGAQYLRSLTPGGTLLLGGILDGEAADVVAALADHGLLHCASRSVEGWTTLELRAPLHDPA